MRLASGAYQWAVTLYDTVPGGTGHLRSFMQFAGDSIDSEISGLKTLSRALLETRRRIQACPCDDGCYNCLYDYENQSLHKKISKAKALGWLTQLYDARWGKADRPLNQQIAQQKDSSHLESDLIEILRMRPYIFETVSKVWIDHSTANTLLSFYALNGQEIARVEHTPYDKVRLPGAIPHTKPDFTIYSGNAVRSYLYLDGAEDHLLKGADATLARVDLPVREDLHRSRFPSHGRQASPVVTLSHDMVRSVRRWVEKRDSQSKYVDGSTRTTLVNGQPVPQLSYVLMGLYSDLISPFDAEAAFDKLFLGFAVDTLSRQMLGTNHQILSYEELEQIRQLAAARFTGKSYGGLAYEKSTKNFRFNLAKTDAERRTLEYKRSWELFWILWQVDQSLVELSPSTKAKRKEQVTTPEGFDALESSNQKALVRHLCEGEFMPEGCLQDHAELGEFGPPFVLKNGSYAFYDEGEIQVAADEIPSKLQDGTHVYIINFIDQSIQDVLKWVDEQLRRSA